MKLSRPSPSMIVALLALVFAMTGTTIAATGAFVITSSRQIKPGAIGTANIKAGSITAAKLAPNAVTSAKLATGAVTSTKLATGAVTATKLGAGAVTSAAIGPDAVAAGRIAAGAVTSREIAAGAVTSSAVAAGAVTSSAIAAGAVTSNAIGAGAVTGASFDPGEICSDGTIAIGSPCKLGQTGYSASASIPSFPGGAAFSLAAGITGNPTAIGMLGDVAQTLPAGGYAWHLNDAVVSLAGTVPANLTDVVASLAVVGVPGGGVYGCSFNPQTTSSCTLQNNIVVNPGAHVGWLFTFQGTPATTIPQFTVTGAFNAVAECAEGISC